VQAAGYVVGFTALVACAIATEGICAAAAFEIGATELSAGAIATDAAVGSGEGAIDYAVAGECNKSLPGLARNMLIYGSTEGALSAGAELVPFLSPAEGDHAVPVHWWNLCQILHQFTG
jgi:hypothetical protein